MPNGKLRPPTQRCTNSIVRPSDEFQDAKAVVNVAAWSVGRLQNAVVVLEHARASLCRFTIARMLCCLDGSLDLRPADNDGDADDSVEWLL